MDYEKAYKETLEKVRELNDVLIKNGTLATSKDIESVKVSDDERIRKSLIGHLKECRKNTRSEVMLGEYANWIAWLKKQGEQNPDDNVEPKFKVGDWIVYNRNDYSREIMQIYDIRDCRYYFTDNVHCSWSIKECDEKSHLWTIQDAKDGDVLAISWYDNDDKWEKIVLFKHFHQNDIEGYGNTFKNGELAWKDENVPYYSQTWTSTLRPATKEQCELLFSKMKEAGYEWDSEKKELRKIEQNPADNVKSTEHSYITPNSEFFQWIYDRLKYVYNENPNVDYMLSLKERIEDMQETIEWGEEDKIALDDALWCCKQAASIAKDENDMGNVWYAEKWLKSIKDRVQPQPKQEWSEYDKTQLSEAIQMIEANGTWIRSEDAVKKVSNWLKSLKDRVQPQPKQEWREEDSAMMNLLIEELNSIAKHNGCLKQYESEINWLKSIKPNNWKPSEEQMNALDKAKNSPANYYDIRLGLQSLYNDLLKL